MSARIIPLTHMERLDEVFAEPKVLLYKHSARCWMCTRALEGVRDLAGRHPEITVYMVDVLANRDISNEIAKRLDIRHESPQAILLEAGRARWHASHLKITPDALEEAAAR